MAFCSHNDAPAARTSALVAIVAMRTRGFGTFRILFFDEVLRFDRHMNHIGCLLIELEVCNPISHTVLVLYECAHTFYCGLVI